MSDTFKVSDTSSPCVGRLGGRAYLSPEATRRETGAYVVAGALVPVQIDRERDEGLYVEPNVWMVHPRG